MQEFNKRSEAVQNLDAEICKLAKQVKELRCKITAVTRKSKINPGAPKAGHIKPNRPCTMEDTRLPAEQPNILGFPVSQNQFRVQNQCQSLSENEVQESEFSQEQNLEDPRKTRAQRLQTSLRVEETGNFVGK